MMESMIFIQCIYNKAPNDNMVYLYTHTIQIALKKYNNNVQHGFFIQILFVLSRAYSRRIVQKEKKKQNTNEKKNVFFLETK